MKAAIILCVLSVASVYSYDILEDQHGQAFYLIPLVRHRRQTRQTVPVINESGAGIRHQGNIFNSNGHKLDGVVTATKQSHGPLSTGADLNYSHQPSGSAFHLGATKTESLGTNLDAKGTYNLWQGNGGNTRLDAVGTYRRHYGGPGGTQHPNYYGGVEFSHRGF